MLDQIHTASQDTHVGVITNECRKDFYTHAPRARIYDEFLLIPEETTTTSIHAGYIPSNKDKTVNRYNDSRNKAFTNKLSGPYIVH